MAEIAGYRENKWVFGAAREKGGPQTSLHCVWSWVNHHTNDNVHLLHLTGGWPGAKSL